MGGVTTSYAYDALDRLTSITSGGSTVGSYRYNGDGLRVSKTVGGVTTTLTWDVLGLGGLGLVIGDGSEYVWGAGLVSQGAGASALYAHQDGLGSTRLVTDSSGAVAGTTQSDAFGATRSANGTQLRFGFTGEQLDAESGLVYLRARYLDPGQGRFLTKDPFAGRLAKPRTLHDYTYVGNNPVLLTDPSGRTWEENLERFWNWVTENGDDVEYLGPGDPSFEEMMQTAGVEQMRNEYASGGLQSGQGAYGTLDAFIETILHPLNGTQAQVGGYLYRYTNNCEGTVTYEITNVLSANSFFYHFPLIPHFRRNSWFPFMGDQVQIFRWTEPNPITQEPDAGGAGGGGERGFR